MANGTLREGTCGLSWSPPCAVRVGQYLVPQTRSVCFLKCPLRHRLTTVLPLPRAKCDSVGTAVALAKQGNCVLIDAVSAAPAQRVRKRDIPFSRFPVY
jgi:hypothetical protein